jgi:hypothetical protein
MKGKNMESKKIKSKDKFVIAMTVQNLIEDGYEFSEKENGSLQVKKEEQTIKIFKFESDLQKWIDEMSLNY